MPSDLPPDLIRCPANSSFWIPFVASERSAIERAGAIELLTTQFARDTQQCSKVIPLQHPLRVAAAAVIRFKDEAAAVRAFYSVIDQIKPTDPTGSDKVTGSGTEFGANSVLQRLSLAPSLPGMYSLDWQRGPFILRFFSERLTEAENIAAATAMNRRVLPYWSPCSEKGSLAQECVGNAGVRGTVGYYQCAVGVVPPACPFKAVQAIVYVARHPAPAASSTRPLISQLSEAHGAFLIHLRPGTYWVGATSQYGEDEQQVTVRQGELSDIRLTMPEE
jgi:hypothetical protein